MKYYFIVNPVSGRVVTDVLEEKIENACTIRGIEYEIYYTKAIGDAKKIAEKLDCEEESVIFAVGGDGVLNEVVNGIANTEKTLGVIPLGSGNDFYRTLKNLPYGVDYADLGKINGQYFINIACVGLDADIANNIPIMKEKKWIPVNKRYFCSIIYSFFKYKFKELTIGFGEDSKKAEYTIVTVCNAQYYGGGHRIAPHAILNDGFFDIYLAKKMPKIIIPSLLVRMKFGKHENSERIVRYSDNHIRISSDDVLACNVDGETMKSTEFDIKIEKSAIRLFNDPKFVDEIAE